MKHYSISEVAVQFGVTISTVHYWRYTQKLKMERVGWMWIVDEQELEKFRKQREDTGD